MYIPDIDRLNLQARVRKAAHDARTPLTSIAGFAQLLVEDGSLSADARENAGIIRAEAERLSSLLESFFDEITDTLNTENTDAG